MQSRVLKLGLLLCSCFVLHFSFADTGKIGRIIGASIDDHSYGASPSNLPTVHEPEPMPKAAIPAPVPESVPVRQPSGAAIKVAPLSDLTQKIPAQKYDVPGCPKCAKVPNPHTQDQTKCPPMPKAIKGSFMNDVEKMQKDILLSTRTLLDVCNLKTFRAPMDDESSTVHQLKALSSKLSTVGIKSPNEVDSYFRCYMNTGDQIAQRAGKAPTDFCHYQNELAPAMKWAAKVSGLDYAVFACKMFREGQWKPNARSHTGAKGYAQFTSIAFTSLNRDVLSSDVLSDFKSISDRIEKLELDISERENPIESDGPRSIRSPASSRAATARNLKHIAELKKLLVSNRRSLRSQMAGKKAQDVWKAFWEGTPNAPKAFTPANSSCPSVAFIAAAAKQVFDTAFLENDARIDWDTFFVQKDEASPYKMMIGSLSSFESSLYSAGVYNGGYDPFITQCPKGTGLKQCIEKLRRAPRGDKNDYTQIVNHMESIQKCATAGNWEPMTGTKKRNCNSESCK